MAVALLLTKMQIHADQQLHTMVLQVTSLTWKQTCTAASDSALLQQTKCTQIPNTSTILTLPPFQWGSPDEPEELFGTHMTQKEPILGRDTAKHLHQSLHCNAMFTNDLYSIWKGS